MVKVPVRIDNEAHRLVRNAFERCSNLIRQRSKLIVNDHDAVVSYGSADVAPGPLQHVYVARNLCDLHLYLAEVLILSSGHKGKQNQRDREDPGVTHRLLL